MYKGSCLCGGVELTISGSITDIIHCHCSLCRKSSGTAFATNGFVNTSELEITKGAELMGFYEVKPGKKRHFCTRCASPVYSSNDENPSKIRIRLGILDSDIEERPISHNFVTSKANWDSLNEDLPQYETFEPSRLK
ncbi:GFA family protein [Vibrio nigripulchritudo]|uniref:GFA family protein n=1 Tax=Vibrio nigripulchritudo TaxID=28173 RepID=UPI0005FA0029|nr:GFA family protein [Vibrio nigripulchritudo]KJY73702.1 aldehyde-activating protein [Vibrio nigripulchritudo]